METIQSAQTREQGCWAVAYEALPAAGHKVKLVQATGTQAKSLDLDLLHKK